MSETQSAARTVTDARNRVLEVRSLNLLEEMDLIEAAGNPTPPDRWMMIATFVATIRSIDGIPCPAMRNRTTIRGAVDKAGPDGLRAAAKALAPEDVPEGAADTIEAEDPLATAKN